jgi:dihydroorotase-like cyclic amidohydrolase
MITLKGIRTLDGQTIDLSLRSSSDHTLDANGRLLYLPGLIDPHISLGSPSGVNWNFGIESAIRGGVTTALDVPSKDSPCDSAEELEQKKGKVEKGLAELKIPLHYFPYVKGNSDHIEELGLEKKIALGSLLLFTHDEHQLADRMWERIFQIAAWEDLPIVINSNNENSWLQARFKESKETLLEKAIYYAERQNARLYVLNVATAEELDLIQEGRSRSLLIYAETTPSHLFPLKSSQADCLWEALNSGVIETIGSGYHVREEENNRLLWQGANFDFSNPIFLLPLLLTAHHEQKITLENVVRLTRVNVYDIFALERKDEDAVLVDMDKEHIVHRENKGESSEMKLKGWPEYVILQGSLFKTETSGCKK